MKARIAAILVALCATSCKSDASCVIVPCPLPIALTVTVTAGSPAAAVPGAFVSLPQNSPAVACTQGPDSTCWIPGGPGTYELDIGAPGYQTMHRSVVVTGTTSACGCGTVNTQHLAVALVAAQ